MSSVDVNTCDTTGNCFVLAPNVVTKKSAHQLNFSQSQTQQMFRCILDAMARPALLHAAPTIPSPLPAEVPPMIAAIALTLCDGDTPLWLSPSLNVEPVRAWLRFHCACHFVEKPAEASFALVAYMDELPHIGDFAQGTPAYPDRSATVCVAGMVFEGNNSIMASGAGINGTVAVPCAISGDFLTMWRANNESFPLGVDMLLCDDASLMALPRTTRLTAIDDPKAGM